MWVTSGRKLRPVAELPASARSDHETPSVPVRLRRRGGHRRRGLPRRRRRHSGDDADLGGPSRRDPHRIRRPGRRALPLPGGSEGRDHRQPDQHHHRPAARGRRDARVVRRRPDRRLRSRARLPRHRAGRRIAGLLHRREDRPAGLRPLREDRRRDGRRLHQGGRRHTALRHPGCQRPLLHLHLDDVLGDEGGRHARHPLRRPRPAESARRCPGHRAGAAPALVHRRRARADRPAARR